MVRIKSPETQESLPTPDQPPFSPYLTNQLRVESGQVEGYATERVGLAGNNMERMVGAQGLELVRQDIDAVDINTEAEIKTAKKDLAEETAQSAEVYSNVLKGDNNTTDAVPEATSMAADQVNAYHSDFQEGGVSALA